MRIGFDISSTGMGKTGCGYFADSLVRSLAELDGENTYLLYPAFGTVFYDERHRTETFQPSQPNFVRRLEALDHDRCRAFWSDPPPDAFERMGQPDLIHSNTFFCPRGLRPTRVVYTLFDVVCMDQPETMLEGARAVHCLELFEASLRADVMLAISEFTRQRFLELFPHYPPERVRVVHPASRFAADDADASAGPDDALVPGQFWLSVATLQPRKNLRRLLRAYARTRPRRPLALVGAKGWLEDDWSDFVLELGVGGDLLPLGYVDDASLRWLYRNCFGLVYVPLAEGFGLPVLEAMALGAPVVASHGSGLRESAGDAALFVNPLDEDEIGNAMARLSAEDSARTRLRERGLQQSRRFSWRETGRKVLEIYRAMVPGPSAPPLR